MTAAIPTHASRRAMIAATITRWTLGVLTSIVPTNAPGIWLGRRLVAALMAVGGSMPEGTRIVPGMGGEWVFAPGVEFGRRAGYYVHGSAFVFCSARTHRKLVARLSQTTRLPFFVVDYRLAPEHRFPAAAEDVEAGYRHLLTQGYHASDIVIAADSAGGHLTCDMLLAHADDPTFQPAAVVLFSPVIDLTYGLAREQERVRRDPAMSARAAHKIVALYAHGQDPRHPRLRLDFTESASLPPVLIQAGGFEMLRADARYLHDELQQHGGTSTLEVWPGMLHVFQALPRRVPEAKMAIRRAADFAIERLVERSRRE